MGLFDPDPDHTEQLTAPSGGLPRRDPAGAANRTATRFGNGPAGDSAAPAPGATPTAAAASAPATEILDIDLVARAKRRMDFLGRNPAAESTQGFPVPAFTDETPIVGDPTPPPPGTALVRYEAGRAGVPDEDIDLGATTSLGGPFPDRDTDTGTGTSTALALRAPAAPSASASAALAAAVLAEKVLAEKVRRARLRRRISAIAVLTVVAILGGVTTGYFAVNWFGGNTPQVRSDPEHAPDDGAGNGSSAPEPATSDRSGANGVPAPDNSSASRSPTPRRTSASPRPSSRPSDTPKPSPTKTPDMPTPTPTPTLTEPVP